MVGFMKPCLFEPSASVFDSNGMGQLNQTIECRITEGLNDKFELNMILLNTDKLFDQIRIGSVISAIPNTTSGKQGFVVEQISKAINGEVSIFATHIAQHRSKLIPISPFTATSLSDAITKIFANSLESNPFTLSTDKTVATAMALQNPRSFREMMGGMEGSLLDVYGGEYQYDNFAISLLNRRGRNNGLSVLYGKNMTDFNATNDFDWEQSATGVLPFWADDVNTVVGSIQYSPYKSLYSYNKTIVMDFTDKFENQPSAADLNTEAASWIASRGLPTTNIEVAFDQLSTDKTISLGDTVHVINGVYNVDYEARIVETEYDVLADRYTKVTVGQRKTSINDAIRQCI